MTFLVYSGEIFLNALLPEPCSEHFSGPEVL